MTDSRFEYDPRLSDIGVFDGGILSDGYGIVSQKVMRDTSLPRDARMLYAYLMSFMNGRAAAFPGVDLQMEELQMGRKKYYAMRGILEDRDLIRIGKGQRQGQRNAFNIYYFNMFPNPGRKAPKTPSAERGSAEYITGAERTALPCDSGEPTKPQVAQQFHVETVENPADVENETALPCASGEPTKPQVAQQFYSDTVHSGTPNNWTSNSIRTSNSIHPEERNTSQLETAHRTRPRAGGSDGRTGGSEKPEGHGPDPARSLEPASERPASPPTAAEEGWERLKRCTVNRNLIHAGRARYFALVGSGCSPAEIQRAWDRVQQRAKKEHRGPRFYPQLKRWLESEEDDGARAQIERMRSEREGGHTLAAAPRSLSALAVRDEVFGRAYWAYCDARQKANQRGADPDRDAECARLRKAMLSERDAACDRLARRLE